VEEEVVAKPDYWAEKYHTTVTNHLLFLRAIYLPSNASQIADQPAGFGGFSHNTTGATSSFGWLGR